LEKGDIYLSFDIFFKNFLSLLLAMELDFYIFCLTVFDYLDCRELLF